jgi:predicted transcriptional regulator
LVNVEYNTNGYIVLCQQESKKTSNKMKVYMEKGEKKVKTLNTTLTVKELQKGSKIDIVKAVKQRANGATTQEIADMFNVSRSAVSQALAPYKGQLDNLHQFSKNRDVYADMVSNKVYEAILSKDIKDIAESEKLSSLGAFLKTQHEITRLETGQSTSNVSVKVVDLSKYEGAE